MKAAATAGLLTLLAPSALPAQSPATRAIVHVDRYHGIEIADPYRWLEDTDSPETRAWIAAQNQYTEAFLAGVPGREEIARRIAPLFHVDRYLPVTTQFGSYAGIVQRGGRYYTLRHEAGRNQAALYVQDSLDAAPRVFLDPNTMAADGTAALSAWSVSPKGRYVAYAIARAGSDWQEWRVRDAATGKDLADRLEWIKFVKVEWTPDEAGFYYGRFEKPAARALTAVNKNQRLYYHKLGAPQSADQLVYERKDKETWRFVPHVTADGRYLVLTVVDGTRSETQVFFQRRGEGPVRELIGEFYAAHHFLGVHAGRFLFYTTYQAPRGRVVSVDPADPARSAWREMVAQRKAALRLAVLADGRLALNYLADATSHVLVQTPGSREAREVPLPANSTISPAPDSADLFLVSSFTSPGRLWRCAPDGPCAPLAEEKLPFALGEIETKQVFFPSKDGTKIPLFLIHRKGLRLDGRNPALLYGYGGFDVPVTPGYQPLHHALAAMGGVMAVACLRGGGEYGDEWHAAGMKQNKQNVFDDFIAAAEWLVARKYTSPERLAVYGASNGGLLVGAVLNQRPELFGAAIPAVGVMDMLRFHKFTVGAGWIPEYGSPDNPEDFRVLRRYSPLHNIRPGARYPATLILTADHDDRVAPPHSFKYGAALQQAQGGKAPILIRIESSAGHGAGKPASKRVEETADMLAFLKRALGI